VRWEGFACKGKKKEIGPRGIGRRRTAAKICPRQVLNMVRLDDLVACYKCRKRFRIDRPSPTVLINRPISATPNADPEKPLATAEEVF